MLRVWAVAGIALVLALPTVLGTELQRVSYDRPPTLVTTIGDDEIQWFLHSMQTIPQVREAFQEGDTIDIAVHGKNDTWWGAAVTAHQPVLVDGPEGEGAVHTIHVDEDAMFSMLNAYDFGNTAKLAVKRQYMTAESLRPAVQLAIGAIARTPADDRLTTQDPAAGDVITVQGCTGELLAKAGGYFPVDLCGARFAVNEIGGISGKLPAEHLLDEQATEAKVTVTLTLALSSELTDAKKAAFLEEFKSDISLVTGSEAWNVITHDGGGDLLL